MEAITILKSWGTEYSHNTSKKIKRPQAIAHCIVVEAARTLKDRKQQCFGIRKQVKNLICYDISQRASKKTMLAKNL